MMEWESNATILNEDIIIPYQYIWMTRKVLSLRDIVTIRTHHNIFKSTVGSYEKRENLKFSEQIFFRSKFAGIAQHQYDAEPTLIES